MRDDENKVSSPVGKEGVDSRGGVCMGICDVNSSLIVCTGE